jgi:ferredoxin-NADP reductase
MAGGYDVALTSRIECGSETVTLRFERPDAYSFTPGQWFTLRLSIGDELQTETFSHCSAPSDPYLEMTTRLTASPFKQALAALELGAIVHIAGPGGRLGITAGVSRLAFLVGGVGITPVRSILREAAARGQRFDDALLLYGNRDETCAPFAEEFAALGDIGVRLVLCYEQPPVGWTGETGFITAETVRRHLPADDGRPYVITGPPVMVSAMEAVLDRLAVPEAQRIIERFGRSA